MRMWVHEGTTTVRITGPADLVGKGGVLRLEGEMNWLDMARWAGPVGLFVLRGGDVRRLR